MSISKIRIPMKKTAGQWFAVLLCTIGLSSCQLGLSGTTGKEPPKILETGIYTIALNHEGIVREYLLYVPKGFNGRKPAAVVMMLHGGGGTGRSAMRETGWADKADQAGFILIFPEASRRDQSEPANFRHNPQLWNDGSMRFNTHVDDVAYIDSVIDDLNSRLPIDPQRIYATGFSNGASMVYRLGQELPHRIAAIAPVAGALWNRNLQLDRPVPLLYMTGSEDTLNPLAGGVPQLATGGYKLGGRAKPPVQDQIKRWAAALQCASVPRTIYNKDGILGRVYPDCNEASTVVFYIISGAGHTWPGGNSILPERWAGKTTDKIKANDVIWDFFKAHPLP
jgi:polyhydroxybutyrate depolymerase